MSASPRLGSAESSASLPQVAESILVGLRLRPMVPREKGQKTIVNIDGRFVNVDPVSKDGRPQSFLIDAAMDSSQPGGPNFSSQERVYELFGTRTVDHAFDGFHSAIMAYGQTGTGKTTTVMGEFSPPSERGLLLRMIEDIFNRAEPISRDGGEFQCTMQMLEVYNEQIRDLLAPSASSMLNNKKRSAEKRSRPEVHVHPGHGVYVKHVTDAAVQSYEETVRLFTYGNTMKAVAATAMNTQSSRAHTIVRLSLQTKVSSMGKVGSCNISDIYVVDLAGRENERTTMVTGVRLVELSFINRSLMWLAKCIHELGYGSGGGSGDGASSPATSPSRRLLKRSKTANLSEGMARFRNSKLTLLLCNALSGNSRSSIITTASPASGHYEETISTLNFAATAKNIKLQAVPNSTQNKDDLVKSLREEVQQLEKQLLEVKDDERIRDLQSRLNAAEALAQRHAVSKSDMRKKSIFIQQQHAEFFSQLGAAASKGMGPQELPYLANVSDDPHLAGRLVFHIPEREEIFTIGSSHECDVSVSGLGIMPRTCLLRNRGVRGLWLQAAPAEQGDGNGRARVRLNGGAIGEEWVRLFDKDRLELGHAYCLSVHSRDTPTDDNLVYISRRLSGGDTAGPLVGQITNVIGSERAGDVEQVQAAREYYSQLQSRARKILGDSCTLRAFLLNAQRVRKLIDEANAITREMKPKSGLSFELATEAPVFRYGYGTHHLPEFCVRLVCRIPRGKLLWDVVRRRFLARARGLMDAVRQLEHIGMGKVRNNTRVVFLWTFAKFEARLHLMRAAYNEWHEDGMDADDGIDLLREGGMMDPWGEYQPEEPEEQKKTELKDKFHSLCSGLQDRTAEARRLRIEKMNLEHQLQMMQRKTDGNAEALPRLPGGRRPHFEDKFDNHEDLSPVNEDSGDGDDKSPRLTFGTIDEAPRRAFDSIRDVAPPAEEAKGRGGRSGSGGAGGGGGGTRKVLRLRAGAEAETTRLREALQRSEEACRQQRLALAQRQREHDEEMARLADALQNAEMAARAHESLPAAEVFPESLPAAEVSPERLPVAGAFAERSGSSDDEVARLHQALQEMRGELAREQQEARYWRRLASERIEGMAEQLTSLRESSMTEAHSKSKVIEYAMEQLGKISEVHQALQQRTAGTAAHHVGERCGSAARERVASDNNPTSAQPPLQCHARGLAAGSVDHSQRELSPVGSVRYVSPLVNRSYSGWMPSNVASSQSVNLSRVLGAAGYPQGPPPAVGHIFAPVHSSTSFCSSLTSPATNGLVSRRVSMPPPSGSQRWASPPRTMSPARSQAPLAVAIGTACEPIAAEGPRSQSLARVPMLASPRGGRLRAAPGAEQRWPSPHAAASVPSMASAPSRATLPGGAMAPPSPQLAHAAHAAHAAHVAAQPPPGMQRR